MTSIWDSLMKNAEIIYKNLEKEKQERKSAMEKQKKELFARRDSISTMKKFKTFGLEDEDEDIELTYERKYPSYLERIAKKHKIKF
jgi:hypothetical protein